ncbi:MAG: hypothetical protein ACI9W4_001514 [Rhodothermales bacterium]|jgi:hypothetical protein
MELPRPLSNPADVLSDQSLARIESARANPDSIVRVVDEGDTGRATASNRAGALTWRFAAENVRDFAWGAFWRPEAAAWVRSAEFAKFSIEFLSRTFFPYPYPHMTTMEGIIGGGMEYPMMTLHEIAHMYFPMIVGQDEKDDTWMDEGLTSFNTNEGRLIGGETRFAKMLTLVR